MKTKRNASWRPRLKVGEYIVTAYAERAAGPGWGNAPIWVIVRGVDGRLREECLQPKEQSDPMRWLYASNEAAHVSMKAAVQLHLGTRP